MIKKVFTLAFLCFAFNIFAQTRIEVSPKVPVNCQKRDEANVNWIYKVQKVSETEEQAIYEFISKHGSCFKGRVSALEIKDRNVQIGMIREGFIFPWQNAGAQVLVIQESETEVRVQLVFDKSILFKNKNQRTFHMSFLPGTSSNQIIRNSNGRLVIEKVSLSFPWKVLLILDKDSQEMKLSIM